MTKARGDLLGPLAGRKVLIVEDRYFIADDVAREVGQLGGAVVGPSPSLSHAKALLDDADVDAALLDVNLNGELVFPVAEALARRGVPIVFLTGWDEDNLPAAWRDRPRIAKPIDFKILGATLARLFAPARALS